MSCRACHGTRSILTAFDVSNGYWESEPCPECTPALVETTESVCPGCLKMASDNEPVVISQTRYTRWIETRCGQCRARLAWKKVEVA